VRIEQGTGIDIPAFDVDTVHQISITIGPLSENSKLQYRDPYTQTRGEVAKSASMHLLTSACKSQSNQRVDGS
jgi:hypothetical protein